MDDFYIISQSKEELQDILGEIEKIANDLGIFINHKKTTIVKLSQPFTYLQLRYYVTSTGHITRKLGAVFMNMRFKTIASKIKSFTFD